MFHTCVQTLPRKPDFLCRFINTREKFIFWLSEAKENIIKVQIKLILVQENGLNTGTPPN